MKLLKELTTYTPISKYIAIAFLLLLPIISFYLGMRYHQAVSQAPFLPIASLAPTAKVSFIPSSTPTTTPLVTSSEMTTPLNRNITSTNIPLAQTGWKIFIDEDNVYSFSYPGEWRVELENESVRRTVRLYFFEDNQEYMFVIWKSVYGYPVIYTRRGDPRLEKVCGGGQVTYGGKSFDKFINCRDDKLTGITLVLGRDPDLQRYISYIEIGLPSINTEKYIQTFDQIMSSFTFNK